MPRNYGTTNDAPYAAAPAVGVAGSTYYNTASKLLYLSDGTAWNGSPAYAEVAATAPTAATPTAIVPPQGLLWVDTSTTAVSAPFFPSVTPPGSGFNTTTDSSGQTWVSINGSAWKTAQDALHCRVNRGAVYSVPTTATALPFDTAADDTYGMYSTGTSRFTCPIAGWYQIYAMTYVIGNAANQQVNVAVYKNGTLVVRNVGTWVTGAVMTSIFWVNRCVATDYLQVYFWATAALSTTYADPANVYGNFDYMGSG